MPVTLERIAAALHHCETTFEAPDSSGSSTDSDATVILESPLSISERIIRAYYQQTIDKISHVIQNEQLSKAEKTAALRALLIENWDFIKGTLLTYTALPNHPATVLWIKVTKYVSTQTNEPIITCLMPSIATDSLSDDYPDLTQQLSIRKLLRTHTLSDKSEYLVPVLQLRQYDLANGPIGRLLNPYFDFSIHPGEYAQLSADEMARLKNHSPETEALFNLIDEYHQLLNSEDNLLAKLQELLRLMTANSVNGIGSEMVAGRGGMIAVLNFFTYYHTLSPIELESVPQGVRHELDILLRHATPQPVLNSKGAPVLDSKGRPTIKLLNTGIDACLALRSTSLKKAIQENERILHGIGLSETTKLARREELAGNIQNAMDNITSDNYRGYEKLGFTVRILSAFNIPFSFADHELELFNRISYTEVVAFFKNQKFCEQFIHKIKTIDELAYVLIIWNTSSVAAAFSTIGDRIILSLSLSKTNRSRFFHLISSLDLEKTEALLTGLRSSMHRFARCGGVSKDISILPEEHCKLYFKHTHDHWKRELSAPGFMAEFFNLQQTHLLHCRIAMIALADIIQAQLTSLDVLLYFRSKFITSLFALFCDMNLAAITSFATDTNSFLDTFNTIPNQHKSRFLELISPRLLEMIPTKSDLKAVIAQLTPMNGQIVFRTITTDHCNHYFLSTLEKKTFCAGIEDLEKKQLTHDVLFPRRSQPRPRRSRQLFFTADRRPPQPRANDHIDSDEETYMSRFRRH